MAKPPFQKVGERQGIVQGIHRVALKRPYQGFLEPAGRRIVEYVLNAPDGVRMAHRLASLHRRMGMNYLNHEI